MCAVCLEDGVARSVSCSLGHRLCLECVERYAESLWNQCRDAPSRVACPAIHLCEGALPTAALAQTVHGTLLVQERQHRRTVELVLPAVGDTDAVRLRYLRHDGTYAAYAAEAEARLAATDVPTYLRHVDGRLAAEEARVQHYLQPATRRLLLF